MIYRSYADIETNYISGNTFGVGCLNMSNIRLIGDENASEQDETQQIIENDMNQVYILPGSFPYEFEYNVIYWTENDDSLVYLNTPVIAYEKYLHVENNYWGEDGLDTVNGLIPSLKYFWDPVWVPDWKKSTPIDKELFLDARQAIMDQDYALAESKFKEIIEDYPSSKYIQASVKEMLVLKRIYDQDFSGLQEYLESVPSLWEDEETSKVTEHVINWCNVEKEDYVSAIDWFEDQIENPESYEDSICAIIDLGYTYLLMNASGTKSSSYTGKYLQYKPTSREAYEQQTKPLINLLFNHKTGKTDAEFNESVMGGPTLAQNYPNPAGGLTSIDYFLPESSQVKLTLFDATGRKIKDLINRPEGAGKHTFIFDTSLLPSGVYYYSLEINHSRTGIRKLVIMQ
jgi:hypothetical protein